jgi:hypothetical protein
LETHVNTKSTGLLLAAAVLLFAFVYFVERPIRQAALLPPNRRVLPGLDPAKITSVQVQVGGGARRIRAEKTNQLWELTQPDSYPASGALIENLLQALAQWEWQSSLDHPNAWDQYGLVQDQFTLLLEENGQERTLKIGRLSPGGDQVYLNARGSDQILVANPGVLQLIPTNQLQWRDPVVLHLAGTPFQRLQVHSTNVELMSLEVDPASLLWKMTRPIEARADSPRINAWLAQLQALRVQGFPPDNTQEMDPAGVPGPPPTQQLVLTFLRDASETNKALELQVGTSPAGRTNLAYARRLQPPGLIEIDKAPLLPWEGDWINFLDRHLLSLSPGLIGSIEVSGGGLETFTAQKTADGPWRVTSAGGETCLADDLLMQEWLSALTNIQVVPGLSPVADKSPYGLDKPASALLHYQLFYARSAGQANPLMADLLFGRGTNQPPKIFELGNDEKYVNSIDLEQFDRLPNAWWELRDRAIWHFQSNEVVAIDLHQLGRHLRFTRDTNNQWTLPPGSLLVPVQAAIEETLYRLGQLRAIYWSGYGEDHLERFGFDRTDYQIAFEISKNGQMETNTIQFGQPSPYLHPYASVMRDGRRLVFEFPVDLFSNLVTRHLGLPSVYRPRQ